MQKSTWHIVPRTAFVVIVASEQIPLAVESDATVVARARGDDA